MQEQAKKDRAREAELEVWRGECRAIVARRERAQEAQVQADEDLINARTQQEAEAAEKAIASSRQAYAAALAEEEPPEPPPPPPDDEPKLFFEVGAVPACHMRTCLCLCDGDCKLQMPYS